MPETDCRHQLLLAEIARDFSGRNNFPTCLDAAARVRDALQQDQLSLEALTAAIAGAPLIAARILRLANAAAYNPAGRCILDLNAAISRIGFEAVRSISLTIAIAQMNTPEQPPHFAALARKVLAHSLQVAAISRTLARRIGRIHPEEAMLAGLVHDIGIFYLLYRAAPHAAYRDDPSLLADLLSTRHAAIGEQLLQALALPPRIIHAVRDHEKQQHIETPSSIRDILYFANLLADPHEEENSGNFSAAEFQLREFDRNRYRDLLSAAEEDIAELRSALAAA